MELADFCQIWVEFHKIKVLSHSKLRLHGCVEIGYKSLKFNFFSNMFLLQRSNRKKIVHEFVDHSVYLIDSKITYIFKESIFPWNYFKVY